MWVSFHLLREQLKREVVIGTSGVGNISAVHYFTEGHQQLQERTASRTFETLYVQRSRLCIDQTIVPLVK
jgi:hypothetical protein